jgi:hypothetical protein
MIDATIHIAFALVCIALATLIVAGICKTD